MVGVSIVIYIKLPKPLKKPEVYYYSTLDNNILKRKDKYNFLYNNDLETIDWVKLKPEAPYFWFVEKNFTDKKKYEKGWSLNKIFKVYSSGIQTKRDKLTIHFDKKQLNKVLFDLEKLEINDFRKKYQLPKDGRDWTIKNAKQKSIPINNTNINTIHYRPFDFRYTYITKKIKGFVAYPRINVMQHFINKENIGLIFPRNWTSFNKWTGAFVTSNIVDIHLIGGQSYIAPLYIYNTNGDNNENGNGFLFKDAEKKDNFTKGFREFLEKQKLQNYSPEEIHSYIYAIMFSQIYREKYFEFFKIDFPKIPFSSDEIVFKKLSKLGKRLIENHLLKIVYKRNETPIFAVEGENKLETILFNEQKNRLYINKTQYFNNFLKNIWEFEIGGYQVFDKYLKARKGLVLSYEEINHIKKIAGSINNTIKIQKIIDNLCKKWI